jgi:hypothetical protein
LETINFTSTQDEIKNQIRQDVPIIVIIVLRNQEKASNMKNVYAVKLSTGYCQTTGYIFIVCEPSEIEEWANEESLDHYQSYGFLDRDYAANIAEGMSEEEADEDSTDSMHDRAGYKLKLIKENVEDTYSERMAYTEFECPSKYV